MLCSLHTARTQPQRTRKGGDSERTKAGLSKIGSFTATRSASSASAPRQGRSGQTTAAAAAACGGVAEDEPGDLAAADRGEHLTSVLMKAEDDRRSLQLTGLLAAADGLLLGLLFLALLTALTRTASVSTTLRAAAGGSLLCLLRLRSQSTSSLCSFTRLSMAMAREGAVRVADDREAAASAAADDMEEGEDADGRFCCRGEDGTDCSEGLEGERSEATEGAML
jgi:hypothetical protein